MPRGENNKLIRKQFKLKPNSNPSLKYWRNRINCVVRYIDWREAILKRDEFKCTLCGSTENIVVHHIKSIYETIRENLTTIQSGNFDIPELWDIKNGVARCNNCHTTIDHKKWPRRNRVAKKIDIAKNKMLDLQNMGYRNHEITILLDKLNKLYSTLGVD